MDRLGDLSGWIMDSKRGKDDAETELQTKIASLILDQHLEQLGYSEDDIKQRIFSWYKSTVARTLSARRIQNRDDIDRIFIGSQREGIGMEIINDLDILQIYKFIKCVETKDLDYNTCDIIFVVDEKMAPPGHTFLWLLCKGSNKENFRLLKHALVNRKNRKYLSAHKYMSRNDDMFFTSEGIIAKRTKYLGRKGPSLIKISEPISEFVRYFRKLWNVTDQTMDYVRGFPYQATKQILVWKCRTRNYDWPPTPLVNIVSTMTAVVVPTGQKGTKWRELQWRICFPAGELALFDSMNIMHKKVYVVLKTVGKLLLRPLNQQITSYVMKNVLFWEAEKRHITDYTETDLVPRIQDALRYLQKCISEDFMPYYMIPERNLIPCKIHVDVKEKITNVIDYLIANGYLIILDQTHISNQNKNRILLEVISQVQLANEATRAMTFLTSKMCMKEYEDYMVEMFFKETNDSYAQQFMHVFIQSIPNIVKYTLERLTGIHRGLPKDILLMTQPLAKLNIVSCEFPPHYFLAGSAEIKCKDTDESATSRDNENEKSGNEYKSINDMNEKISPSLETSVNCPADKRDECSQDSVKDSTVLEHQISNKKPKKGNAKKGTKALSDATDAPIPVPKQTKLLTKQLNSKNEQTEMENKTSFSSETMLTKEQQQHNHIPVLNKRKQTPKIYQANMKKTKTSKGKKNRRSKSMQNKKEQVKTADPTSKEPTMSTEPETNRAQEKHQVSGNICVYPNKRERTTGIWSSEGHLDESDAKLLDRNNTGKLNPCRKERTVNKKIKNPTDPYNNLIAAVVTLLDILLLLRIFNSDFFEILLILSNNFKYVKEFLKYLLFALISVSSFNFLAFFYKCLNEIKHHTQERAISTRRTKTWKKLQQLCKNV
ncbi:uncharacterized protein LOC127873295 isoform X2 [Dreissena polymorpha]|uniref:Mab-21-like HhH/H2TH-like domain-containing protein n=1 Tax=Dreissena polymorpha TaxID=45954 RepID=A0A9D4QY52_DREPO|nr:uncharacterized protein LOC127873295 isoform X2 [Dreissena polymorpha]KAH3846420.1 hypothetical protein DPMN_088721 [Dreissena polymorpha]